jgi:hypothetical protein
MQLAIKQIVIRKVEWLSIKVTMPDNEETKEGRDMNNITTINGIILQSFALVYPNLKSNGICNPTIVVNINKDALIPMI